MDYDWYYTPYTQKRQESCEKQYTQQNEIQYARGTLIFLAKWMYFVLQMAFVEAITVICRENKGHLEVSLGFR